MSEPERRSICRNRRARFQYHLEDRFEAGIVLVGSEVKSLRAGQAHLNDAYARIRRGELYLVGAHIAPYEQAGRSNHDPGRDRKLLLHRREIDRLQGRVREKGFTLVPTEMYFTSGRAKVEIALARGKRLHDKREAVAKREAERDLRRVTKRRTRGR